MIEEVDTNGNVVAVLPKSKLKERMFLHKVSLVIPITKNDEVLISRRAKDKTPYPDTWSCAVGGKVSNGESYEDAANREMIEEVGRSYPLRKVTSFVYDKEDYKAIFSVFTTTIPIDQSEFVLDHRETQYSKSFSIHGIMEMISKNPDEFAPTFIAAIREFAAHYRPNP